MRNYFLLICRAVQLAALTTCVGLWILLPNRPLRAQDARPESGQWSVTVYPIVFSPDANIPTSIPRRVAEVVGLLLEKKGVPGVEVAESTFSPESTEDMTRLSKEFVQFLRQSPQKTKYAVFGAVEGTPETGITGICTLVVDSEGKVVVAERAGAADWARAKIRPVDPMSASEYLVSRLEQVPGLSGTGRRPVQEGKMAAMMRQRSGVPSDEELAAMARRWQSIRSRFARTEVAVYPAHLWTGSDAKRADGLARVLNEQGVCRAIGVVDDPQLKVGGDPNEQKVLWDLARAFREFLRQHPPAAPYALLVDYGIDPATRDQREASHVHLILCDRRGDWVMVDYQNSHHADFKTIRPRSRQDCDRLAALRLQRRLAATQ